MNAAEYDKMFSLEDTYWWFVARRNLAIELLDRHVPKGKTLDVGCGTGAVAEQLAKSRQVVGLDMSSQALAYMKQRGLPRLIRADGTQLPLQSESFQAVIGLDIFEHIQDDQAAFAEAHRVLQPEGILVLSVPAFMALWSPHDVALHHFRRYRKAELVRKLRKAGFEVTKCSYSVFLLFPLVVLSRILEKFRHGEARASLPMVPSWLNSVLIGLMRFEAKMLSAINLPWGSSLVVVARKRS